MAHIPQGAKWYIADLIQESKIATKTLTIKWLLFSFAASEISTWSTVNWSMEPNFYSKGGQFVRRGNEGFGSTKGPVKRI